MVRLVSALIHDEANKVVDALLSIVGEVHEERGQRLP